MVTPLAHPFPEAEHRIAERYSVHFPVEVRWHEAETGELLISEGLTENVGLASALVSLDYLPSIGSRLSVTVREAAGALVETQAEVVRLDRSLTRLGTAALYILGDNQRWQASVWEAARREALNIPHPTDNAPSRLIEAVTDKGSVGS